MGDYALLAPAISAAAALVSASAAVFAGISASRSRTAAAESEVRRLKASVARLAGQILAEIIRVKLRTEETTRGYRHTMTVGNSRLDVRVKELDEQWLKVEGKQKIAGRFAEPTLASVEELVDVETRLTRELHFVVGVREDLEQELQKLAIERGLAIEAAKLAHDQFKTP